MGKIYWSKWGGARAGVEKEQLTVWSCQSCGVEQVNVLPAYMIPDDSSTEFFRVCTLCKHHAIVEKYLNIWELISGVKKFDIIISVENLGTVSYRW